MPGLLGTLELGSRSLQTQQQGVEVTGHNIANVNNPNYARQRLQIQTSPSVDTGLGQQGTGVNGVAIVRLRSELLDQQIQSEASVTGYLETVQRALNHAETDLGQTLNTQSGTAAGTAGSQTGLAGELSAFFSAAQALANDPASVSQRQVLLAKAADLAARFNQTDQRLSTLQTSLNATVETETAEANTLLGQIADLNARIGRAELGSQTANDLRDLRQEKIESLAKLVKIEVGAETEGGVSISMGGTTFVSGGQVQDRLQAYDAGGGQILLRAQSAGTPLTLTGGSLAGAIEVRDGAVTGLRQDLNSLAASLMTEVNAIHRGGYNLNGGTGADFFTGTGAGNIQVNAILAGNPALVQASSSAGESGNNQVALAMARLVDRPVTALGNQTVTQRYNQIVAGLGQSLASANMRLEDQKSVGNLLAAQRDSLSGVSLDEEMTDMVKYQKAFQASARLISTIADMLDTVIGMKQ
jgi:flagellar hook-associated protein 1 FlgK